LHGNGGSDRVVLRLLHLHRRIDMQQARLGLRIENPRLRTKRPAGVPVDATLARPILLPRQIIALDVEVLRHERRVKLPQWHTAAAITASLGPVSRDVVGISG